MGNHGDNGGPVGRMGAPWVPVPSCSAHNPQPCTPRSTTSPPHNAQHHPPPPFGALGPTTHPFHPPPAHPRSAQPPAPAPTTPTAPRPTRPRAGPHGPPGPHTPSAFAGPPIPHPPSAPPAPRSPSIPAPFTRCPPSPPFPFSPTPRFIGAPPPHVLPHRHALALGACALPPPVRAGAAILSAGGESEKGSPGGIAAAPPERKDGGERPRGRRMAEGARGERGESAGKGGTAAIGRAAPPPSYLRAATAAMKRPASPLARPATNRRGEEGRCFAPLAERAVAPRRAGHASRSHVRRFAGGRHVGAGTWAARRPARRHPEAKPRARGSAATSGRNGAQRTDCEPRAHVGKGSKGFRPPPPQKKKKNHMEAARLLKLGKGTEPAGFSSAAGALRLRAQLELQGSH